MFNHGHRLDCYSWLYDKHCPSVQRVRANAAKWEALDELYNYQPREDGFYGKVSNFWMGIRNAQAVRNRFRVVVAILREAIAERLRDGEVRILCLASGSTQSVIKAASTFPGVRILAVDEDSEALRHAAMIASEIGVDLQLREADVLAPSDIIRDFRPHIIEVVGLMDYLTDRLVVGLLGRIRRNCAHGALVLIAHIHPNPEQEFLREVVDWVMFYRTAQEVQDLIERAGYHDIRLYPEPHGIHTVFAMTVPAKGGEI